MKNLNSIFVEGRLTREVVFKNIGEDNCVCGFSLAINGKGENDTVFISVECWNTLAMNCQRYLGKGSLVRIVGSLGQKSWTDEKGINHNVIFIKAEHIEFNSFANKENKTAREESFEKKVVGFPC